MTSIAASSSRYVETDSNERLKLARAYTPAECVGQLVENSAAVLKRFNATSFELSILSGVAGQIQNPLRPVNSPDAKNVSVIKSDALKVIDNGTGFLFDHVRTMLRSGYRHAHESTKLFGEYAWSVARCQGRLGEYALRSTSNQMRHCRGQ